VVLLQWGRSFGAAETRLAKAYAETRLKPSMGPQLWGCGNPRQRRDPQGARSPSMGPQLWGCGNPKNWPHFMSCSRNLQWGRSFGAAETPRGKSPWSFFLSLQWGRSFGAAETPRPGISGNAFAAPSMGPQLWGCGNIQR